MNFPHWHYFLALCDDLEKTDRFAEIAPENFKTFSIEYTRLYLASGSEIDVVARQLCQKLISSSKADTINDYRLEIVPKYPDLPTIAVTLKRHNITLLPWQSWVTGTNPAWWGLYNKVKHQRHLHYKDANLENTVNALAGLMVLVGYLYGEELATHKLVPLPKLMLFDSKHYAGTILQGIDCYVLPGIPKPKVGP